MAMRTQRARLLGCRLGIPTILVLWALTSPAAAGELKILSSHLPPYSMDRESGERGFVAEITREIARRVGADPELHYAPWARVYKAVRHRPNRLLAPIARTEQREDDLSWVVPVYPERMMVFTLAGTEAMTLDEAAEAGLIGVQRNSSMHELLRERGIDRDDLLVSANQKESARLLEMGRIDAWVSLESLAIFAMKEAELDPDRLVYGETLKEFHIYIGGSPDLSEDVKQRWRDAFEAMKDDGTYRNIMAEYGS